MGLGDFTGDSGAPLLQAASDSVTMRVMNVEADEQWGESIVHVIGRDQFKRRWHIEVRGHRASFFIRESEYTNRLDNHYAVDEVEQGYKDLHDRPLRRVYVTNHDNVKSVRKLFDWTGEADVWFQNRFLIDKEVYTSCHVDLTHAEEKGERHYVVDTRAVRATDSIEVDPRVLTVDIEVAADRGFPEPKKAEWPVSTIVTHDSYSDDYRAWALVSDEWDETPDEMEALIENEAPYDLSMVSVYEEEQEMLTSFNYYIADTAPDLFTGWFSNRFDWPYLINRSKNLNCYSYREWSPTGDVWVSEKWGDPAVKGATMLDMKDGYIKTQIHKLKKKTLDYVAERELGRGKVDLEQHYDGPVTTAGAIYKWMWEHEPSKFVEYNIRDVEAVVRIEEKKGIVEMFDNMREITGAQFEGMVSSNINMIDMFVLRRAAEWGYRLPTSEKPDEDWYFGAHVFDPTPGLHYKVVYPDLASLYPNMMRQCNMSPETLIGTRAELAMSQYSEDDCVWSWHDPRPVKRLSKAESRDNFMGGDYKAIMKQKKDGGWKTVWADDPKYVKLYYLSPDVKEGFVASLIHELIGLKDIYRGSAMYEAVKRVVNSVYGVFGDSNTYGRGFRLFDHRFAESITLGGRKTIKYTDVVFRDWLNQHKEAEGHIGPEAYRVGGDTDSVMTSIQYARSDEHALELAQKAAAATDEAYGGFCEREFGLDEHHMKVEIESYGRRCFFQRDMDSDDETKAVKKRYAQVIHWNDDDGWLDEPKIKVKGMEMIRSDVPTVTQQAQEYIFEAILTEDLEDAQEMAVEWVNDAAKAIRSGDFDYDNLGIPVGIGQELWEYGSENRTPQPGYRGAKYANQQVYEQDAIQPGDKPLMFYVDAPGRFYRADTAEDGREVDAISVIEADDLPNDVLIDVEKMLDRALRRPLEGIFGTMGWDLDRALRTSEQATLDRETDTERSARRKGGAAASGEDVFDLSQYM